MNFKMGVPHLFNRFITYSDKYCAPITYKAAAKPSRCCGRTPLHQHREPWDCGEVPADGKPANIIPLCKKGMREDPGNHRPVSLTSVPEKLSKSCRVLETFKGQRNHQVQSPWVHKGKILFS